MEKNANFMDIVVITLEKAFEPQITQKNTDYQGLAEFKALTLRVNYDKKKLIRN